MIEPSSGRTMTSGPGAPLLLGLVATAALVIVFLIGFQLGSGQQRVQTVIVGASGNPGASGDAAATGEIDEPVVGGRRIQRAKVDDELKQAYYANLRQGGWVVCTDGASLGCQAVKPQLVDANRGFKPPESYWEELPRAVLDGGPRTYLAGDVEEVFVGTLDGPQPHGWRRLLGVTLNGSVQFLDLGELAEGRYVVMDRRFTQRGQVTLGAALTVESNS